MSKALGDSKKSKMAPKTEAPNRKYTEANSIGRRKLLLTIAAYELQTPTRVRNQESEPVSSRRDLYNPRDQANPRRGIWAILFGSDLGSYLNHCWFVYIPSNAHASSLVPMISQAE